MQRPQVQHQLCGTYARTPRRTPRRRAASSVQSGCAIDSPLSLSNTGPATLRHTRTRPARAIAHIQKALQQQLVDPLRRHVHGPRADHAIAQLRLVARGCRDGDADERQSLRSRLMVTTTPHAPRTLSSRQAPIYTHLTDGFTARIGDGSLEQRRRLRLKTQLGQHRRDRQRRRQAVAVLDLERDAESFANEGAL